MSRRRLRVLLYSQNLSGVGHYVRSHELARALATHHEVHLVKGGRPMPHKAVAGIHYIELPRIARGVTGLVPLDGTPGLDVVMDQRRERLCAAAVSLKPEMLVIEHYPFSKWVLADEIGALIEAARAETPHLRVLCSVRDIPLQTRHEACTPEKYGSTVLAGLTQDFDAIMVHGEHALTPLEHYFPRTHDISLPIAYTGIVAEPYIPSPERTRTIRELTNGAPFVLASVGGGADPIDLLGRCIGAWRRLRHRGLAGNRKLILCTGLAWTPEKLAALQRETDDDGILLRPFTPDFLHWMAAAELSISCAGYNTCANVLETRCRALLMPNTSMADQMGRASVMAGLGVAQVIAPPDYSNPDTLAEFIARGLGRPLPHHELVLNGAQRACAFIEQLVGIAQAGSAATSVLSD